MVSIWLQAELEVGLTLGKTLKLAFFFAQNQAYSETDLDWP